MGQVANNNVHRDNEQNSNGLGEASTQPFTDINVTNPQLVCVFVRVRESKSLPANYTVPASRGKTPLSQLIKQILRMPYRTCLAADALIAIQHIIIKRSA